MKHITLFTLLFITSLSFSQATILWGNEISVADGTTYGNVRPRIALSADGNPVVLIGGGNEGILYSVKGNGNGFESPVSLLPDGVGTYLSYWTGPDFDSKGDTVIAVFKALPYDSGKIYMVRSTDGGLTYSDTIRIDSHETGMAWMPAIGMDESGDVLLTYMAHDGASLNPTYIYSKSTDGGLTYSPEQVITSNIPGEACDCCPAEIILKGTNEVLLFRNNESNIRDIYASFSSDGGANFSSVANVDQTEWYINTCPSTGPDGAFVDDNLLTVFASKASGYQRLYISKSSISGNIMFTESLMLEPPTNQAGKQNYPRISNDGNTTVVVWVESEGSNNDLFCGVTIDGSLESINTSKHIINVETASSQTNPDVVVNGGEIHLVYQDYLSGNVIYRKGTLTGLTLPESASLKVYPNPVFADKTLLIEGVKTLDLEKIKVVNSIGKEVQTVIEFSDEILTIKFDDSIETGTYFIQINPLLSYTIQVK
jgi:hypothetical protein